MTTVAVSKRRRVRNFTKRMQAALDAVSLPDVATITVWDDLAVLEVRVNDRYARSTLQLDPYEPPEGKADVVRRTLVSRLDVAARDERYADAARENARVAYDVLTRGEGN